MIGSRSRVVQMEALALLCSAGMVRVLGVHAYTFCMLTSRRPGPVSYLSHVAGLYRAQDVFGRDGTGLTIIDVDGWTAERRETGTPVGFRLPDRARAACTSPDVEGIPSCQVRQRTLDVLGALSVCLGITSGWVILVEDDCEPCPGALSEALGALAGLSPAGTSMAKLSSNMCATAFPAVRVPAYSRDTLARLYTHPHDIIMAENWAGPETQVYRHSRNLWHHIGNVSTEPHTNTPEWQALYAGMRMDTCFDQM